MATKTRRCSKTHSVIYDSKLEADLAIARIASTLAHHRRNRYRDQPQNSYECGSHWHITKR